jgi:hypothetical protein
MSRVDLWVPMFAADMSAWLLGWETQTLGVFRPGFVLVLVACILHNTITEIYSGRICYAPEYVDAARTGALYY